MGYHLVVHGLVTGMIRFRLPVEAALTIPAGITVAWLADRYLSDKEMADARSLA